MKHSKLISWIAAAFLGVSAAFLSASGMKADATLVTGRTPDNIWYRYDSEDDGVTISGYSGTATSIRIPSSINNKPVTGISDLAFQGKQLTSILFPDTLRSIGWRCFDGCSKLESVTLPSGLTYLGEKAFADCTGLKSVTVPEGVKKIEASTFSGCTSLKSLEILGATVLMPHSVSDCTALESIRLPENSVTQRRFDKNAIENCPKLFTVNGVQAIQHSTDSNGVTYPYIHPSVTALIRNHFSRSTNVGFVNAFCTELCEYIVATETDSWMNDALKARQLHDWLIHHCEYEDELNGENQLDSENHVASSVFLSYAINVRGTGIGESVCDGYAKAYTMLLSAAGIESYYIGRPSHVWNFVKIQGVFYHVDVTGDDKTANLLGKDSYYYDFLRKSNGYDNALQQSPDDHPLLMKYTEDVSELINHCSEDYPDVNHDGISDDDFDLSGGFMDKTDWTAYHDVLQFLYGSGTREALSARLPEVLSHLHQRHMSFWECVSHFGPLSQSVPAGQKATFAVTMFGDSLTYQWSYRASAIGQWITMNETGSTLSFTATAEMNNREYICTVRNKNGIYSTSYPAVLTVTPAIRTQPRNAAAPLNENAEFTVKAEGTNLTYQWQYYNKTEGKWKQSAMPGAKTASLTVQATAARSGQKYRCIIRDSAGHSVISSVAAVKPTARITAQPKSLTAKAGKTAVFSVAAEGGGLSYQWQYYDKNQGKWINATFSGSKTAKLTVPATTDRNGMKFRCRVRNNLNHDVYSNSAVLKVTV